MFLCIPLVFGVNGSLKQEREELCVCPRCKNAAVQPYRRRKWFEVFWIPLIPLGSKHVWFVSRVSQNPVRDGVLTFTSIEQCPVCQWSGPIEGGFQPQHVGGGPGGAAPDTIPAGRGYDVGYSTAAGAKAPQ
ncbi:hypothetical protein JCM1841_000238 [Sporobolomyces salmonicolor]